MTWFIFAVLSAIFWGTEGFLHKVSASKGYNSSKVSAVFCMTGCLLSGTFIVLSHEQSKNIPSLMIIAFLNSVGFFSAFITRLEALKKLDASIFFSISRPLVLFLILLMSFFILHEQISIVELLGVILMIAAMYLLLSRQGKERKSSLTHSALLLTGATTLLAAFTTLTLALASRLVGPFSFSFISYALSVFFSFGVGLYFFNTNSGDIGTGKLGIYILATCIGFFNFFGLVFYLTALKTGTFAIVGSINNLSILLTIIISIVVFREKLTVKQVIGIGIAFISIMFLRL